MNGSQMDQAPELPGVVPGTASCCSGKFSQTARGHPESGGRSELGEEGHKVVRICEIGCFSLSRERVTEGLSNLPVNTGLPVCKGDINLGTDLQSIKLGIPGLTREGSDLMSPNQGGLQAQFSGHATSEVRMNPPQTKGCCPRNSAVSLGWSEVTPRNSPANQNEVQGTP
jgi:hypothetical protein